MSKSSDTPLQLQPYPQPIMGNLLPNWLRRQLRSGAVKTLCAAVMVSTTLPAMQAKADIYRYVDRSGVEHYTNVQPSSRGWQRILRSRRPEAKRSKTGMNASSAPRRERPPDPERLQRYDPHIREAARLYQLPEAFIRAVMRVESNFYADAMSNKGAIGLMQLMPRTAESMGVTDPHDPRQNVLGGARYLRVLANQFQGDLVLTIAAYNAGGGAVRKYDGVPPYRETRRYVRNVLQHYYSFKQGSTAAQKDSLAKDNRTAQLAR